MANSMQIVTAAPMQGPLPFEAAYNEDGKVVNPTLDALCRDRHESLAPEYYAHSGPALTVHDTLEQAEALLGWFARINGGVSEPVKVWKCSDTGRYQIGY